MRGTKSTSSFLVKIDLVHFLRVLESYLPSIMSQLIDILSDVERSVISSQIGDASDLAMAVLGARLTGGQSDLAAIQKIIDSNLVEPESTYLLQSLGLAFGRVFVELHNEYEWCMVEDEYGRDPAIRYKQTSLLMFPLTIISKRVERGEKIDVTKIHNQMLEALDDMRVRNYSTG